MDNAVIKKRFEKLEPHSTNGYVAW